MLSDTCFESSVEIVEALVKYSFFDYSQAHIDEALEGAYALAKLQGRLDYPRSFSKLSAAKYEEHIRAAAKGNIARWVHEAIEKEQAQEQEAGANYAKLFLGVSKLNKGKP